MSHYTVMVFGPTDDSELATVLAPFSEELQVERYLEDADWYLHEGESHEEAYLRLSKSDDEGEFVLENGVLKRWTSYNPMSKWDWYTVGGRWHGYFPLKSGATGELGRPGAFDNAPTEGRVDRARKGDIDFETERSIAAFQANEDFTLWENFVNTHGMPPKWDYQNRGEQTPEEYREAYNNLPVVQAMYEVFDKEKWGWFFRPLEEFGNLLREEYITIRRNSALMTYAALIPGEGWIEPGEMGWFGMSSDTPDTKKAYYCKMYDIIENTPDDTVLTVVDCHI